jgi:peptide/nickel transport system substrate-binding protein
MPSRVQPITALAAAAVLATLLAVASCASPDDRRTPDDTLVVLTETAMTTADPRYAVSNYDAKLWRLVHIGLTAVDTPDLVPRLDLAASIDRLDDLTYDATLRDNARFSDGTPVTADDVVDTFESVLADPAVPTHRNIAERLRWVEAITPRLVRFHLVAPVATFLSDLDFGIVSSHGDAAGAGLGAGPYQVRELTQAGAWLDVNPYYWGEPPRLPHVELRVVPDAAARVIMLVGGSADLIQNGVRMDLVDDIAARPHVQLATGPSVILSYLMMNTEDPVLKDVRVRQAIALAIDRPAIVAASFHGRAVLATGLLPPSHPMYAGNVPHWNRDLARANAMLDAAGLPRGADGIRAHFIYKTSSDAFRLVVARELAAQLAEVGLDVEVRGFEFATFFADVKRGDYQLASMQTSEITGPDYYFSYFHSSRIPSKKDPDATNRWRYRNADVDRLTALGRRTGDPVKARAIYDQVQRIVATEVPIVPLWHEDNVVLSRDDVSGFAITPNARLRGLIETTKAPR